MFRAIFIIFLLLPALICADFYKTLEITQDASEFDIKKAFRRLSVK